MNEHPIQGLMDVTLEKIKKMVGYVLHLLSRWLGRGNLHFLINLHGVSANNFPMVASGQINGEPGLSRCSWSCNDQKRNFPIQPRILLYS